MSLVCSKKAENSQRRSFGPDIDLPCQGGCTTSLLTAVCGFCSKYPGAANDGFTLKIYKWKKIIYMYTVNIPESCITFNKVSM